MILSKNEIISIAAVAVLMLVAYVFSSTHIVRTSETAFAESKCESRESFHMAPGFWWVDAWCYNVTTVVVRTVR